MISRELQLLRLMALGLLVIPLTISGCKRKAPPPPPPPPPPSGPAMISPNIVAQSMSLSASVVVGSLPETECSEDEVRAMLDFANDFATGNDSALMNKMQGSSREVLSDLVETGAWSQIASDLDSVVVTQIKMTDNQPVLGFDVVSQSGQRDPLAWVLVRRGDTFTFQTQYIEPKIDDPAVPDQAANDQGQSSEIHSSKEIPPPTQTPDPRKRVPTAPTGPGPG